MADDLIKPAPATRPSAFEPGAADRAPRLARAQARRAERLAAALAMIAGFVDAYGMITYGVYVSFMSGNTTQTGYQTAEGAFGPASLSALAILSFVVGSFAGTLLVEAAGRLARRVVLGVVAAALAAIVGFTQLGMLPGGFAIAAISCAMGVMNSALSRVGAQAVSLTFVTGEPEPRRIVSRIGAQARAPPGFSGTLGHPSAPRAPLGPALGWLSASARCCRERRRPGTARWSWSAPALILGLLAAFDRPDGAH